MTFFTPFFFNGKNVRVEVATAGNTPKDVVKHEGSDLICDRTSAEQMPMLFLILNSFSLLDLSVFNPREPSNFSVLGMGDVFLPGLMLVYALKLDYLKLRFM